MTELVTTNSNETNLIIHDIDVEFGGKEITTIDENNEANNEANKDENKDENNNSILSFLSLVWNEIITTDDMPNLVEYLCPYDPDEIPKPSVYFWMFIIITLRGVSQVYLCAHPIAAIIICIALALSSIELLVYALIGSAVSSLSALIILKTDYDKVKHGLCGYDGVLASLAVYVFLANGHSDDVEYHPYELLPLAIAMAISCGIIHETTANIMHLAHLPPFTVAFNIVTMCVLVAITRGTVIFAHWKTGSKPHSDDWSDYSAMFFVDSFFRGVGQLIFCDTTLGGGLITLALIIGRQRDGIFSFIGSVIGSITALFICRVPYSSRVSVRNGLFGYNPCAVAIVMGGGRFYQANAGAAFIAIVGSMLCVLFQVAMAGFFFVDGTGLPTLTYPFFVASWIMMMSQSQWLESLDNRDENNENVAPVRKRVERMSREVSRSLMKQASQKLQGVSEVMLDARYSASDSLHRYHDQLKQTLGRSKPQIDVLSAHRKKWAREVQKQQAAQRHENQKTNVNGTKPGPGTLNREASHRDWRKR